MKPWWCKIDNFHGAFFFGWMDGIFVLTSSVEAQLSFVGGLYMLLKHESMKYFFTKYHNILTKLITRISSM
jgi:hypothetical protein